MIMIRTDANQTIATGHLMRTLTIAKECVRRNEPVCFLLADKESERILHELCPEWENFQIDILNSNYRYLEEELPVLRRRLALSPPRALLVDSYFATEHYLAELGKHTGIFYLDDFKEKNWPVEAVIHYGFSFPDTRPTASPYRKAKKCLLGTAYAPLREVFSLTPYQVREKIVNIMITTGGTDEENMAGKIVDAVLPVCEDTVTLHVAVGVLNRHREELRQKAGQHPQVIIQEGLRDMAGLMERCDLAFSAAGTTLYELCAMGVPTICFAMADNQVPFAEGFELAKAVIYEKEARFAAQYTRMAADYPLRQRLSATMRQLVDGKGAARIVDELLR